MNVNVKRKKDPNNFINVILNKISLAQNFSQKVALSITKRKILKHVTLKFYLRRRYKKLILYVRVNDKFRNKSERGNFYRDLKLLIPSIEIEGTKGHYKGFGFILCPETNNDLILLLKLISLCSRPKDFYVKNSKMFKSFYNYIDSSPIPIHLRFANNLLSQLTNEDLIELFNSILEEKVDKKKAINNIINIDNSIDL